MHRLERKLLWIAAGGLSAAMNVDAWGWRGFVAVLLGVVVAWRAYMDQSETLYKPAGEAS